jgi:ribonucleoside-diphosphate reductase alpha chain
VSVSGSVSGSASVDPRAKARLQGYEGDPCGECGNFTLVRNGTCLKCNTCGGTSGCS